MIRKKLIWWGGCTMALAASSFSSASYLTDSETIVNHLTVQEAGLDGILKEPSWDSENAQNIVPGAIIPKDPQVTNTSDWAVNELISLEMKLVYGKNSPKAGQVMSREDAAGVWHLITLDFQLDEEEGWIPFPGEERTDAIQHFYYSKPLPQGDTTLPLFTQVSVLKMAGNSEVQAVRDLGGYELVISGMALGQSEKEDGLDSPQNAYRSGLFQGKQEGNL